MRRCFVTNAIFFVLILSVFSAPSLAQTEDKAQTEDEAQTEETPPPRRPSTAPT